MTVHALLVDPPRPGQTLLELVDGGPEDGDAGLTPDQAAALAGAMIRDAAVAVANSGGELLVNHPAADQLPAADRATADPAAALRDLLDGVLEHLDDVRFEPQVGGSNDARLGNTVTHLLREEGADSVAVLDGRAPTLARTDLDRAAMKLRRSEVVVGPAPGGRVAYLGLTAPIDFGGLRPPLALQSVVDRAIHAGHDVDFLPMYPRVDDPEGLASVVAVVGARRAAGRRVPEHTAAVIESLGLTVVEDDGRTSVRVRSTDRD